MADRRRPATATPSRGSTCWPAGADLGRSVLTRGDHARLDELSPDRRRDPLAFAPEPVGARAAARPARRAARPRHGAAFNEMWFRKPPAPAASVSCMSLARFFHPLDGVPDWNRIYGRAGFVQYQFVVPFGAEARCAAWSSAGGVAARPSSSPCSSASGRRTRRRCRSRCRAGRWPSTSPPPRPASAGLLDGSTRSCWTAGGRRYLAKDAPAAPDAHRRDVPTPRPTGGACATRSIRTRRSGDATSSRRLQLRGDRDGERSRWPQTVVLSAAPPRSAWRSSRRLVSPADPTVVLAARDPAR